MREIIEKVEKTVQASLQAEASGHDWPHVRMVRDLALRIADKEGGNRTVIELAALVHDVGDRKFNESEEAGDAAVWKLLRDCGVPEDVGARVADIARRVSFKGAGVPDDMPTLEGRIVQDADRLCALGAVGIARAFAYGGSRGRALHEPEEGPRMAQSEDAYFGGKSSTINHFYEKLLLVKDRMHTDTARRIAENRHAFMEDFLKRFMDEWDSKDVD